MIKLLIADDHVLIREGVKNLASKEPDLKIVGETSDPLQVLESAKKLRPDLIILDISMPGKSGLDVLKELKIFIPEINVLMMSMLPEEQFAKRVLKAGASGYITKDSSPEELLLAIRKTAAGRKYISQSFAENLAGSLDEKSDKPPIELLSDREFQILKLIASGNSQTSISKQLSISISTVNTYRKRILEKLNFSTNAELIHFAITNKLID